MYFNFEYPYFDTCYPYPRTPYTNFYRNSSLDTLDTNVESHNPSIAVSYIKGGPSYPNIKGIVSFLSVPGGSEVSVYVEGLPSYKPATKSTQPIGPFGFHIHSIGCCDIGNPNDPFTCASGHWNPDNQPHGNHAGDFPVLFSNHGMCKMSFFTDRFKPKDIIGLSVIIHESPDDYRSQPSGNSGKRIACGLIQNPF